MPPPSPQPAMYIIAFDVSPRLGTLQLQPVAQNEKENRKTELPPTTYPVNLAETPSGLVLGGKKNNNVALT